MDKGNIWNVVGAFSGVVFVALAVIGTGLQGDRSLEPTDASSEIARALIDRSDDARLGGWIALVGILFFFPFLAYFRNHLRKAEGEDGWLTSTVYGGGLVTAAMLLAMLALSLATVSISNDVEPVVAKVLVVLSWRSIWVLAPPLIAFTLFSSLAIVRYSALPRWLGWVGFVVSLTLLVPWIGILLAFPWMLLVSLTLTYQAWRSREPAI